MILILEFIGTVYEFNTLPYSENLNLKPRPRKYEPETPNNLENIAQTNITS